MDVRLSQEQRALRDSAAQVVRDLGPRTVAGLDDGERRAKLDAAVDATGWRELRAASDAGGPWASGVEVAIIAEALAYGAADTPFVDPTMAADLRRRSGRLDLGPDHLGADDRAAWTALGLATTSADLVGTMRGALDLATAYARERRQYGRAIGSFQAVQHLLADGHVATEGARSATLHAAWAVDALAPADALAAAAVAKAWCARAALDVCEMAIQVHGGIGNTWECFAHVHLRRALHSIDLFGGVGPSLERVLAHHGIGGTDGLR